MIPKHELEALLEKLIPIVRRAGDEIMNIYSDDFAVQLKEDESPVTEADMRAESLILPALGSLDEGIPIVSEEQASQGNIPAAESRFWLVDPLDGTKEFINRNGEFTVNVALIDEGEPVLGVVFAPALDCMYAGAQGVGAFVCQDGERAPIVCRMAPEEGLTVISSRSHGDAEALDKFLAGCKVAKHVTAGSSLKLCLIAAGKADVYPRLGRTMEWDIAAGDAVLRAAGGRLTNLDASEMSYGKPGFENSHFSAWGRAL